MPAPPCKFRDLSDEAYRIEPATASDRPIGISVWLCSWPTTLGAVPRWVEQRIGKGLAIDPERDCTNCPVRQDR